MTVQKRAGTGNPVELKTQIHYLNQMRPHKPSAKKIRKKKKKKKLPAEKGRKRD